MKSINVLLALMIISFLNNSCQPNNEQGAVVPTLSWELEKNLSNSDGESLSYLTIKNDSDIDFSKTGWKLYFNFILSIRTTDSLLFEVNHVNGDLRAILPKDRFKGLKAGEEIKIPLLAGGSILNFTDAPNGFYIVYDKEPDTGIACKYNLSEIPLEGLNRSNDDILPVHTAQVTFDENALIKKISAKELCPITPTPIFYQKNEGTLKLSDKISIGFDEQFKSEAELLKQKLQQVFKGNIELSNTGGDIQIQELENLKKKQSAYNLKIANGKVIIESGSKSGAFYGTQSLLALIPIENWKNPSKGFEIDYVEISDQPRFEYRGIFLDVARNFQPKENVLKLLDNMAFYKLNKFHFHICDDEGWRLEIPGLPELTEFGSRRGHSANEEKYLVPSFGSGPVADEKISHGCGYYTREDFIEILKYANERHIEVIPEIDMPGHARAAIKSMEKRYEKLMAQNKPEEAKEYLLNDFEDKSEYKSVQGWTDNVINVGLESSYTFLTKVTDEVIKMFNEAGADLKCIHTGGDEVPKGVWTKSPACDKALVNNEKYSETHELSSYFIERFAKILAERNIVAGGWEEISLHHGNEVTVNNDFVGLNFRPYVWNNMWNSGAEDLGYQLANAGYPIVLANVTNLYFDLAYHKHPEEPGYYWGNFIDTRKAWEYTPMDLSKCADVDRFGQPIDSEKVIPKENRLTEKGRKNVLGIQGLLWSENNLGEERLEYFMYPKLIGLAERAWSAQPAWAKVEDNDQRKTDRELGWAQFVNKVGQFDLARMDYINGGVGYRIPTPGAKLVEGILHVNIRYPGLIIRYTTDGTEPDVNSQEYTTPVAVSGVVKIRAFNSNGRVGRVVILN